MISKTYHHVSILAEEIQNISPTNGVIVDATLGGAGHSRLMYNKLQDGQLISIDRDDDAIKNAVEKFGLLKVDDSSFQIEEGKKSWLIQKGVFGDVKEILNNLNIQKVSMILADIGVSSYQIDNDKRGFSFMERGPLDMRMDKAQPLSAKDLINGLGQKELERIFREFGEERYSKEIASAIVKYRSKKQITNTIDIVEIINKTIGERYEASKHPARRIFQALRIAVNDELGELDRFCRSLSDIVEKNGIVVILTFHSLERSMVEKYYTNYKKILPDSDELSRNSRSKSCVGYIVKF